MLHRYSDWTVEFDEITKKMALIRGHERIDIRPSMPPRMVIASLLWQSLVCLAIFALVVNSFIFAGIFVILSIIWFFGFLADFVKFINKIHSKLAYGEPDARQSR